MDLEDLRAVQTDERSADSLQPLPDSFYADVGEFIEELREQRDRAAEQADDPFGSDEVRQLTDEIETAEEVVEAIYERRVGKVVKRASLAAAGLETDKEGLTAEETDLFEQLVGCIQENRQRVLDVLAGELDVTDADGPTDSSTLTDVDADPTDQNHRPDQEPDVDRQQTPDPPPEDAAEAATSTGASDGSVTDPASDEPDGDDLDIAEAMASDTSTDGGTAAIETSVEPASESPTAAPSTDVSGSAQSPTESVDPKERGSEEPAETATALAAGSTPETDRLTVRITQDVGEILGIDERVYDLQPEDVVTLPTANAEALLERDAAETIR
ncbi:MAG: hypothetical protein SVG88_04240 [Halobacteriales archaeon]|nr:hypothetical protein [Halobacteriales archaeon]